MTDTYTMDDSRTHTAHIHVSRRFALSLLTTYSSRPVPVPIPVLHRYRYSSQALCLCYPLFLSQLQLQFCSCSCSAVAVAVGPQPAVKCAVLRAACSACCSSVPQLQLCSSSALQWCCCCGGGACECAYTHTHTHRHSHHGTAHSLVVYIYNTYILPMRAYAGCGVYDTCIVHRIYLVYTIHRRLLDRPRLL